MQIYFTEDNKREYMKCVQEIVDTNWWSEGKYTQEFEQLCKCECGTKDCLLYTSDAADE